jgi:hypothetical protein
MMEDAHDLSMPLNSYLKHTGVLQAESLQQRAAAQVDMETAAGASTLQQTRSELGRHATAWPPNVPRYGRDHAASCSSAATAGTGGRDALR